MSFKPTELIIDPNQEELILTYSNNFSYNYIPIGCCLKINEYQEMIVNKYIKIEGKIILKGDIAFVR